MNDEKPDLTEVLARISKAIANSGFIWAAQGAMGWMIRGDIQKARTALENLPTDRLPEIVLAAAALGSLAVEIANTPPT